MPLSSCTVVPERLTFAAGTAHAPLHVHSSRKSTVQGGKLGHQRFRLHLPHHLLSIPSCSFSRTDKF